MASGQPPRNVSGPGPRSHSSGEVSSSTQGSAGGAGDRRASDQPAVPTTFANLEFVDMNATSQAERQRNKRVIRSTAMRSFRQKQKLQREKGMEETGVSSSGGSGGSGSLGRSSSSSTKASNIATGAGKPSVPSTLNVGASSTIPPSSSSSPTTLRSTLAYRRGKAPAQQANVGAKVTLINNPSITTQLEPGMPDDLALTPEEKARSDSWSSLESDISQSVGLGRSSGGFIIGEVDRDEGDPDILASRSQEQGAVVSPLNLVGQGRVDPFRIQLVNTDIDFHELIDHCKLPCLIQSSPSLPLIHSFSFFLRRKNPQYYP